MSLDVFDKKSFITYHVCVSIMTSRLGVAEVSCLYNEVYLQMLNVCPFQYIDLNTSWVTVVIPTESSLPKRMSPDVFDINFHYLSCVSIMTSRLGVAEVRFLYNEVYLQMLNVCPFHYINQHQLGYRSYSNWPS